MIRKEFCSYNCVDVSISCCHHFFFLKICFFFSFFFLIFLHNNINVKSILREMDDKMTTPVEYLKCINMYSHTYICISLWRYINKTLLQLNNVCMFSRKSTIFSSTKLSPNKKTYKEKRKKIVLNRTNIQNKETIRKLRWYLATNWHC